MMRPFALCLSLAAVDASAQSGVKLSDEPEPTPEVRAVPVRLVSSDPDARWDVILDDEASCTTPCARELRPGQRLVLKSRKPNLGEIDLADYGPLSAPVEIAAHPRSLGMFATGLTLTSLGGAAGLVGGILAGVGCPQASREGLCNGGIATAGSGVIFASMGLFLLFESSPYLEFRPLTGVSVRVGEGGGVAGEF